MQYRIIGAESAAELMKKVNEACDTGEWMPLGGVAIQPLARDEKSGELQRTRFIQAMQACLKVSLGEVKSLSFIDAIKEAKRNSEL